MHDGKQKLHKYTKDLTINNNSVNSSTNINHKYLYWSCL